MSTLEIHGDCHPDFESVRDAFIENFQQRGDVGSCVCIMRHGEVLVDLWAGIADQETGATWERDTKAVVWSTTKGLASMCALKLVDQGKLDLFAPVTDYWPEYGKNGKEATLVAHILSQQAGMSVFIDTVPRNGSFDWDLMVRMIENQAPHFEPGTRVGYSPMLYGWLVGELVRRVSGKSLGTFFHEEIAGPLNADCWIGLPEEKESEIARMAAPDMVFQAELLDLPGYELTKLVFANSGGYCDFSRDDSGRYLFDTREAHAAEIGGGGGIANARGLARAYAPWANGGIVNGQRFISEDMIARAANIVSATSCDNTLRQVVRFTMGFHKSWDNRSNPAAATIFMNEDAFGFAGNGGSVGFADPSEGLSFGYVMNYMNTTDVFNRAQSLIDATYRTLGYTTRSTGSWRK